jgi:hypothetical protein
MLVECSQWTETNTSNLFEPIWYSFMSGFTNSFTTSIAKWPALCPALWPASLKTLSHRVKHMVKLQKHSSPLLMKLLIKLFPKNNSTGEAELCQTGPLCRCHDFLVFIIRTSHLHVGPTFQNVTFHRHTTTDSVVVVCVVFVLALTVVCVLWGWLRKNFSCLSIKSNSPSDLETCRIAISL